MYIFSSFHCLLTTYIFVCCICIATYTFLRIFSCESSPTLPCHQAGSAKARALAHTKRKAIRSDGSDTIYEVNMRVKRLCRAKKWGERARVTSRQGDARCMKTDPMGIGKFLLSKVLSGVGCSPVGFCPLTRNG